MHVCSPDPGVRVRIRTYSVIRTKVRKRKQYGVRVKKENEVQVREVYGFISKKEVWSTENFWTRRCVNGTGTELFSKVVYGVRNVGRKCTEFSNIIFQQCYTKCFLCLAGGITIFENYHGGLCDLRAEQRHFFEILHIHFFWKLARKPKKVTTIW